MCYFSIVIRVCSIMHGCAGPTCYIVKDDIYGTALQWVCHGGLGHGIIMFICGG